MCNQERSALPAVVANLPVVFLAVIVLGPMILEKISPADWLRIHFVDIPLGVSGFLVVYASFVGIATAVGLIGSRRAE